MLASSEENQALYNCLRPTSSDCSLTCVTKNALLHNATFGLHHFSYTYFAIYFNSPLILSTAHITPTRTDNPDAWTHLYLTFRIGSFHFDVVVADLLWKKKKTYFWGWLFLTFLFRIFSGRWWPVTVSMISAGVEGRLAYMTYPDHYRGPSKQPPEFLRPAPKPLPSAR